MSEQTGLSAINPNHYQQGGLETRFLIEHCVVGLRGIHAVYVGNVIKYISRAPYKNGVEDLNKAIRYLQFLGETLVDGECIINIYDIARYRGLDAKIWKHLYDSYEGEDISTVKEIIASLNRIFISIEDHEKNIIRAQAYVYMLIDSMEGREKNAEN